MAKSNRTQPRPTPNAVTAAAQQLQSQQVVTTTQLQQYSGQIPPPDLLRGFDEVLPGAAAKLIQWADDEQQHRRRLEVEAQAANIAAQQRQLSITEAQTKGVFRSDMMGQSLGFMVCLACIGCAFFLGLNGQTAVAIALAAIPTGAVIYAFRGQLFGRKSATPDKPV